MIRVGSSWSARLGIAFGILCLLAVTQGMTNYWAIETTQLRVLRGRIAGDLQNGFQELSSTKQRLKVWSLRVLIGAEADLGGAKRLLGRMRATLVELRSLDARAADVDRRLRQDDTRDDARIAELDILDRSVQALDVSLGNLAGQRGVSDALTAWRSIERVFDEAGGLDLRALLDRSIARESAETATERRAADSSILRMRQLSLLLTSSAALVALFAAFIMLRALRRPLAALEDGSRALVAGDLSHRLPECVDDEFGRFGKAVNAMALELFRRREHERHQMAELERLVDRRTRELRLAMNDLKSSEVERRHLFADIAHELRTPAAAIRGEAEVSLRYRATPKSELRATLERVKDIAITLGRLIDDVLTVARDDSNALTVHLEPCCLVDAVERAMRQLRAGAQSRSIGFVYRGMSGPVIVLADKARLIQAFVALIDNAVRYSHDGSEIGIRVAVEGDTVVTTIQDSGIGISEADLPRIFDRAFRGRTAREHRGDGAGLGLTVAKTLADKMNLKLDVRSRTRLGTTVTIAIAIAE